MKNKLRTKKLEICLTSGEKVEILNYDTATLGKKVWKVYKDGKLFVKYAVKDVIVVNISYLEENK